MADRDIIAGRYAKAFFAVARQRGRTEDFSRQLAAAAGALVSTAGKREFWASPVVSFEAKSGVLERGVEALGESCGSECAQFLRVLLKNDRLAFLGDIAEEYDRMQAAEAGRKRVRVSTAAPLSDTQTASLKAAFEKKLGAEVTLKVSEDPSLLAGIIVRTEDTLYDGSVRGRLERLLKRLSA